MTFIKGTQEEDWLAKQFIAQCPFGTPRSLPRSLHHPSPNPSIPPFIHLRSFANPSLLPWGKSPGAGNGLCIHTCVYLQQVCTSAMCQELKAVVSVTTATEKKVWWGDWVDGCVCDAGGLLGARALDVNESEGHLSSPEESRVGKGLLLRQKKRGRRLQGQVSIILAVFCSHHQPRGNWPFGRPHFSLARAVLHQIISPSDEAPRKLLFRSLVQQIHTDARRRRTQGHKGFSEHMLPPPIRRQSASL